jgi:hypothetical protein
MMSSSLTDEITIPRRPGSAGDLGRDLRLRPAALRSQPLPAGSPLCSAPNIILTQHTVGGSGAEIVGKAQVFVANLARYRSGLPLASVVDWAKVY